MTDASDGMRHIEGPGTSPGPSVVRPPWRLHVFMVDGDPNAAPDVLMETDDALRADKIARTLARQWPLCRIDVFDPYSSTPRPVLGAEARERRCRG